MKKFTFAALLQFRQKGAEDVAKKTDKIEENLKGANRQADKLNKKMGKTATSAYERGDGYSHEGLGKKEHRVARSVSGARGASGREFSGMSSDTGGFVAAYATIAANLFAITAAFQALSKAAQFEQLEKGLVLIGARAGSTLSITANGLKEVTGYAVSTAEAMRTVAQATAAGFGSSEIERIGAIAKGASVALGRDMSDSMDRLTRGVIKLEPELLDEIGIMTRLDEAVKVYALENNKVASSLTQTEKRQAFMNAVLAEGEKKFGAISESIESSPYDQLSASVRELGTGILVMVNGALSPFVKLMAEMPVLALLPLMGIMKMAASKILPDLGKAYGKLGGKIDTFGLQIEANNKLLDVQEDKLSAGQDMALSTLVKTGSNDLDSILNPTLGIKNAEAEILNLKRQGLDVNSTQIRLQKTLISQLREIQEDELAISNIKKSNLRIDERAARVAKGRSLIKDFVDDRTTANLGVALKNAAGTMVSSFSDGFKTMTSQAITFGKIVGSIISKALGFITLIVSIGTVALSIYKSITTTAADIALGKLKDELKEITKNAVETNKQVTAAFTRKDYTTGFEGAINSLSEIINKLIEIRDFNFSSFNTKLEDSFLEKGWFAKIKRFSMQEAGLSLGFMGAEDYNKAKQREKNATRIAKEDRDPVIQGLALISKIRGEGYSASLLKEMQDGDPLTILKKELDIVGKLSKSWSTIGEEASKAGKAINKYFGKSVFDTDYSDVASSFKSIGQEANNIAEAFLGDNLEASAGIFQQAKQGGEEFFKEMDRLAGRSDSYYTKYYNNVLKLYSKRAVLERQDAKNSTEATKAALASIEDEILLSESTFADKFQTSSIVALSAAESYKASTLEANVKIEKSYEKVASIMKTIAELSIKISKENSKQRDFALFGKDMSKIGGIAEVDAVKEARDKASIEQSMLNSKLAVIRAEYALEDFKMTVLEAQITNSQNNIAVSSMGRTLVGKSAADAIVEQVGGGDLDKAISQLSNELNREFYKAAFGIDSETLITLVSQNKALDAQKIARVNMAEAARLQGVELRQSLSLSLEELNTAKAARDAYLQKFNIKERELAINKKIIDQENTLLSANTENAKREQKLIEAKLDYLNATSRAVVSPDDARLRSLAGAKLDKQTIANTIKSVGDNATSELQQAALEYERTRDALQARIAEAKDPKDIAILSENLSSLVDSYLTQSTAIRAVASSTREGLETELKTIDEIIKLLSVSSTELGTANAARLADAENKRLKGVINTLGMSSGAAQFAQERFAEGGGIQNFDASEIKDIKEQAKAWEYANIQAEGFNNIMQTVESSIGDAFGAIIDGSQTAGQAFSNMAISILKSITEMITKMLIFKAIEAAGNAIVPGAGTIFTSFMGGRKDGGIMGYANGGIADRGLSGVVKEPTYLVGEGRQNEAVVPLPNGRSIPVQMTGGGGGDNNVSVNINMTSSGDQKSSSPDPTKLGQAIAAAVQRELVAQKAPGGLLSKYGA